MLVGASSDLERRIGMVDSVKVETCCEHGFNHAKGRFDIGEAMFARPALISWHFVMILHADRAILMPVKRPIRACLDIARFVKGNRSHGACIWSDQALNKFMQGLYDRGKARRLAQTVPRSSRHSGEKRFKLG
ncbi:MAG: hypothetical protein AAFY07_00440 [Pseudomonadota bacterium]